MGGAEGIFRAKGVSTSRRGDLREPASRLPGLDRAAQGYEVRRALRTALCAVLFAPIVGCPTPPGVRFSIDAGSDAGADAGSLAGPDAGVDGGLDAGIPCRTNADCPPGPPPDSYYCERVDCAPVGVCTLGPFGCPALNAPACGCDGQTWTNPCTLWESGVGAAHDGPCATDAGPSDGGSTFDGGPASCVTDSQCASTKLCCVQTGSCYDRSCLSCCEFPVFDAGSPCLPESDSAFCAAAGVVCGMFAGVDNCGTQRFAHCDACTGGGTCCETASSCCSPLEVDCCFVAPQPDGGRTCSSNTDCAPPQYCAGEGCGSAGHCLTKPVDCPAVDDPRCGCDGMTYDNACLASAAGARVEGQGACEVGDAGP